MKKIYECKTMLAFVVCCLAAMPIVAAVGGTVPARHVLKQVMGRDYWTALYPHYDHAAFADWANGGASAIRTDNPEVNAEPFIREAVPVYHAQRCAPADATGLATWRTLAENFLPDEADREIITDNPHPDRPLIVGFSGKRHDSAFGGKVDLDKGEWRKWKAAHPNLIGCWTHIEWDNALPIYYARAPKIADEKRRAEVQAFLGPRPTNRYEHVAWQRRYYRRMLELYYGDGDVASAMFASRFSGHLAAALGAKLLIVETTNTTDWESEYRWNVSPMFARGAARQFGLPWEWYVAVYMNGPTKDGKWLTNVECVYPWSATAEVSAPESTGYNPGPDFGVSRSLQRRAFYFAYLNGANFVEQEEWTAMFLRWDEKAGKTVLSERGNDFRDYHNFTKRHPGRGTPYTPVAILVPVAQGYPTTGGYPWMERSYGYTHGDHAVDAVFFTLVPGYDRVAVLRQHGEEHNLNNSRHAAMYDVLAPDAGQPQETFLEVLKTYKAAVVVGDYPDRSFEPTLKTYEQAGGRVIRIGSDEVPAPGPKAVADVRSGRLAFPKVERIFDELQRDYFPVRVMGDCLYGLNRTETGWWLWVFNNKGVTKFATTPQVVDAAKDALIAVDVSKLGRVAVRELLTERTVNVANGTFRATVAAGDLAIFELTEQEDK